MSRDELATLFANPNTESVKAALAMAMESLGLVGDDLGRDDALRVLTKMAAGEGAIAIGARFASARVLLRPSTPARRPK